MEKQKADRIITKYFRKIYGFALKKAFSYEETEDLCGEIVQEVYLSLRKAEEIVNLEGYIWRISENTYSRYVSSKKRHLGISLNNAGLAQLPFYENYDSLWDDGPEELARLRREIAFLTEQRRKIVYLFYYQNMTVSRIAKLLKISQGTVKWHLNKARKKLKEGFSMERTIGRLGIHPVAAASFDHSGNPGNGDTKYYLGDKLNLNIVYSVYFTPRTMEEIAQELGITLVFIEDRVNYLEANGFLTRISGNRFTTYVCFTPRTYSREAEEQRLKQQLKAAELLAEEYVPMVRRAVAALEDVYIPGGSRELLEAAAVFYGVSSKCSVAPVRDLSKYYIKPTTGGNYIAIVNLKADPSDPDYTPTLFSDSYWVCGDMNRISEKYPKIQGWSADTKYCARSGGWANNLTSDYEALYEFINGTLTANAANEEKFRRLRERRFLTDDNRVNVMTARMQARDFFDRIPSLPETLREKYAGIALESAMTAAKEYPPQMQDWIIRWNAGSFIGTAVSVMVLDILYGSGAFRPLTENEKVTSQLILFADILPAANPSQQS